MAHAIATARIDNGSPLDLYSNDYPSPPTAVVTPGTIACTEIGCVPVPSVAAVGTAPWNLTYSTGSDDQGQSGTVPPSILDANGNLPSGIGGLGTPIQMPASADANVVAEQFATTAFNGQTPVKVISNITGKGSWVAIMPDGTAITYRPAGQASAHTDPGTATVEINNPAVKSINNGNVAKFKFPSK